MYVQREENFIDVEMLPAFCCFLAKQKNFVSGLNYDKVVKNNGWVLLENLKNVKREVVVQTVVVFCTVLYQIGWWVSIYTRWVHYKEKY